jgi:trimethylamine--corrinoid protein Co-methyltransferase
MFCSVGAGHDLIVNCGMFATGLTCSHEQLIIDDEISACSRRLARGLTVNEETIALDLIKEVGPGTAMEKYMISDHTLKWLNSDEYYKTKVSVRGPFAAWQTAGSKDTYRLANDLVKEYRKRKKLFIDAKRKAKLDEIAKNF